MVKGVLLIQSRSRVHSQLKDPYFPGEEIPYTKDGGARRDFKGLKSGFGNFEGIQFQKVLQRKFS